MIRVLFGAVVVGVGVGLLCYFWGGTEMVTVFDQRLRESVFSGFLTLAGFLVSASTFVAVQMKEGVFDSGEYRRTHAAQAKLGLGETRLAPLRRLIDLNVASILGALLTAVASVTLGLRPAVHSVSIIGGFAGATIVLFGLSVVMLYRGLTHWLSLSE